MNFLEKNILLKISFVVISIFIITILIISQAPKDFPNEQLNFHIEKGESISSIADDLYKAKLISSSFGFKVTTTITSRGRGVKAGDYKFIGKENLFKIVNRLITGDQKQIKEHIVIFEGTNVQDIASIYFKYIPNFNAPRFISLAKKDEGYLYPDTYDFLENVKAEEIIKVMKNNFNYKIKTISKEITGFNKALKDIIIMASIVEKEANNNEDREIVAGILWKRLEEGIPLQVDPPFYYITGRTNGVTFADLKIDSPYNTYIYKGLPKGPITNPGIEAIRATVNPVKTKYYFYLTGRDSVMHYATTYDGHLKNKSIYLK